MPLPISKIRNGFCYVTSTGQVRIILKIGRGGKVYYMTRGWRLGARNWRIAHTLNRPPSIEKFAKDVKDRINPCPPDSFVVAKEMLSRIAKYK
jgi:hypothetical protein